MQKSRSGAMPAPLPASDVTLEPAALASGAERESSKSARGRALPQERGGTLGTGSSTSRRHSHGLGQPGARAPPGGAVGRRLGRPADELPFLLKSVSSLQPVFFRPEI